MHGPASVRAGEHLSLADSKGLKNFLETGPIFINAKEKIIQLYFESCSKTLSIICANAGGTPSSSPVLSALPKPMNFS